MFSSKFGKLLLKSFCVASPSGPLSQDESFCVAFFKKRLGFGATPHNNAVSIRAANYWFIFLRLLAQKKNGEKFLNVTHPNFLPAFFFDTSGARKKLGKKETPRIFRACGRDLGRCPKSLRPFLKKGRSKTFILCE